MSSSVKPRGPHKPLVGRADDFRWYLEKHWSCPYHREPHYQAEWEEEGEICLDCMAGEWVITKDEEGWATLVFVEKSSLDYIMGIYAEELTKTLNNSVLLGGGYFA